ncbi:histidine phosphatase family protein [Bacillus pseudomycoides]|uniref:Histidine phosphatase family protein n=1 Tax=Bacillus pseudomycoides TaxID=64104 RepID=A0A2A8C9J1_9BACI|nr:histidine phosphatase family protein [Bacillus pseudomycoides]PEA80908.1 histidine phosphatase family protein [Bacillus pseudomycoides]PEM71532.1 histidine phosphatase family protein [Bacillus pseudomycoides]PFZ11139.1 histidine phosphatase family protein [Bacillus pseudomycoides]PGC44653.1 histidine phosphatase family protein [Bacillus pseudomycoides]PGD26084.1 histidine phosphatase family protein [Bacillus pseudomycoides]
MKTFIYMVRHGESPKIEENERTRGLTEKGELDTYRITDILQGEGIDVFVSSPYHRSILTIQGLAKHLGQEVIVFEDLKERIFSAEDKRISDKELLPLLQKSFSDPNFALKGGESNAVCQKRAIKVFKELLKTYRGQKIVLGTHGAVMTLMMGYYDSQYDLNFLLHTSKPDIYRMEFNGEELEEVKRLWK